MKTNYTNSIEKWPKKPPFASVYVLLTSILFQIIHPYTTLQITRILHEMAANPIDSPSSVLFSGALSELRGLVETFVITLTLF